MRKEWRGSRNGAGGRERGKRGGRREGERMKGEGNKGEDVRDGGWRDLSPKERKSGCVVRGGGGMGSW